MGQFQYVITDTAGIILGLPPGNVQDFEGAGFGTCLVWGLSYAGELTAVAGDNALEVALSDECFDLSDNFISVVRDTACDESGTTTAGFPGNSQREEVFVIAPNPVSSALNVGLNVEEDSDVFYQLSDINGHTILQGGVMLKGNGKHFSLDMGRVQPGVYILQVQNGYNTETFRVLKK